MEVGTGRTDLVQFPCDVKSARFEKEVLIEMVVRSKVLSEVGPAAPFTVGLEGERHVLRESSRVMMCGRVPEECPYDNDSEHPQSFNCDNCRGHLAG
jgi:hypothetical protein